jgi:hypothetical protein
MKTYFEAAERVMNRYKVIYDEVKLKESGYETIEEYCLKTGQNPFDAECSNDAIIEAIEYCEITEYLDSEPLKVKDLTWEK